MPDIVVASDAIKFVVIDYAMRGDFAHIVLVAIQTVGIEMGGVRRPNANRLVKALNSKRF